MPPSSQTPGRTARCHLRRGAATALLVYVAGLNAWSLLPLCVIATLGWSLRRATARRG